MGKSPAPVVWRCSMTTKEELLEIETGFWHAVGNPEYYREHMADSGIAVFGEPYGVMRKADALRAAGEAPELWRNIRIEEPRVQELDENVVLFVYKGSAEQDGRPYSAYCSSVYVNRGGVWQLALHQQSPPVQVPEPAGQRS
jgi:hypothetical protein